MKKLDIRSLSIYYITFNGLSCIQAIKKVAAVTFLMPIKLKSVQRAVDSYQDELGGLLPIKTKELETDIYIKYPIEFSKIVPSVH